jgi:hypothetical protein
MSPLLAPPYHVPRGASSPRQPVNPYGTCPRHLHECLLLEHTAACLLGPYGALGEVRAWRERKGIIMDWGGWHDALGKMGSVCTYFMTLYFNTKKFNFIWFKKCLECARLCP